MSNRSMKRHRCVAMALLALLTLAAHGADVPTDRVAAVQVTVGGKVTVVDAAVLSGLPHVEVVAAAHDEPAGTWRGVALADVLQRAGVALDKPLRGRQLATFVRVTASDQYQVVFGLSDLDPTLGHTQVLLVDQRDGKTLEKDGPYRLLVPGDKRPARWVRNVASIEVVDGATTPRP